MEGNKELVRCIMEKIYEQESGIKENLKLQNFLNLLLKKLKDEESYKVFLSNLKEKKEDEEDSTPVYIAIKNFIVAILVEYCDSEAKAEYMINTIKDMIMELSEAIKASRIYEKIK